MMRVWGCKTTTFDDINKVDNLLEDDNDENKYYYTMLWVIKQNFKNLLQFLCFDHILYRYLNIISSVKISYFIHTIFF